MFRKAMLILSGNAFSSLMLLVRNLLVARLVSVEDYGIAATFAISMAIVEMASGLGLQQLIVQDKEGNDPELQAGLQGLNLLRGGFAGLGLFFLAHPISLFLGIPDIAWAYQLLALLPILRGFEHFDVHRVNRAMQFTPLVITKTLPTLLSVLALWPLNLVYNDYRVMLYSVLLHWVLTIITGHLVAKRGFRVHFRAEVIKKGFEFGWPLLINNIMLFVIFQGDRLLVGRELGMAELAIFSMGITFTMTPTLVSASSEQHFFLPQLSAVRGTPERFIPLALTTMQVSLISAMALVLAITFLGEALVQGLLGEKYLPLIPLLPWLAIWQACRTLRVGNTIVALSLSQTTNAMIANGLRLLAFPLAWYALLNEADLLHVIWLATGAELCAYGLSIWLVTRRAAFPKHTVMRAMALPLLGVLTVFAAAAPMFNLPTLVSWGVLLGGMAQSLISMRALHGYIARRSTPLAPDHQ